MRSLAFLIAFFFTALLSQAQNSAHTLLYKIEGNGLATPSYLYGTMHTADDAVFALMDSVLIDFGQAKAYVMEINTDSVNMGEMQREVLLEGDTTLKTLLTDDEHKKLGKLFRQKTGYPLMLFNKLKPLYIMLMMQEGKKDKNAGKPLDLYFDDLAKKEKKTIYGLEKPEDQLALLKGISTSQQIAMLKEVIAHPNEEDKLDNELMKDYTSGDLDKLLELTLSDTSLGADFNNKFINKRNIVMAAGIDRIIHSQPAFIAVGAAHLPGENGVIELLRKKGYKVSPVISSNRDDPKKVKALAN